MNIVSHANVFLAIALNEPEKDRIIELTTGAGLIAPEVLPYEIGNALPAMFKRKQVTKEEALLSLDVVAEIPVRLVSIDIHKALSMAVEFSIYAYDAYFIQCAISLSSPLLTLDRRMKNLASVLNIEILE